VELLPGGRQKGATDRLPELADEIRLLLNEEGRTSCSRAEPGGKKDGLHGRPKAPVAATPRS
jgi:hypothetical protein